MSKLKLTAMITVLILFTGLISLQAEQTPLFRVKEIGLKTTQSRPFFFKPSIIIFEPQELYIAESGEGRIQVFTLDGQLKQSLGGKGKGPAEMESISGLDIFEDRIYAVDNLNKSVKIFDKSGKSLGGFLVPFDPVNIAVLDKEKIVITHRVTPRVDSENLVYCFNSKGELQWKAVDPLPDQDLIYYTLINETLLLKDGSEYLYLIWKNQNKYFLKIDKNGKIIEKIILDSNYPCQSIDLPLKKGKRPLISVCWNATLDNGKFYFITPSKTEDGDLGPGKDVYIINDRGQINGIIKFPRPLKRLAVKGQLISIIDTEDELYLYQLEGR